MKHKQLIFINAIILIIFIFVVRIGIKQESIAHARFIEESMQVENNEDGISNTVLTDYYYAHSHTLEDIQHPPWFHEEHITNPDDEDTELGEDIEEDEDEEETEELELADQEYNHEEVTAETNDQAGTSNDSGGQVNTNRPSQPDSSGQENSSNDNGNSTEQEKNNNDGKNEEEDTNNDPVEAEDSNSESQNPEQPGTEEPENNQSDEYEDD